MKKFLKKLSFAMAILMSFSLAMPVLARIGVYAGTNNSITITDFATTGIKGGEYTIKTANEEGVTTSVKDPYGRDVLVESGKFTPDYTGNYKIKYTLGSRSTELTVVVSKGDAQGREIKFDENSEYIVPAKIDPENAELNDTVVILPNPYVVDKDGEVVEEATVTTEVYLKTISGTALLTTGVEIGNEYTTLTLDKETNGTYTIKYKYKDDKENLIAFTSKTIVADTEYNNNYQYSYNYNTTTSLSAEIGVATKLPQITATNKTTKEKVNVYYTVKAEITIGTTKTTFELGADDNVITFVDGYYYFTPILDGNYVITYDVVNFFGNEPTVSSSSFTISNVADTVKPVPMPVLPDAVNGEGVLINHYTDITDATEAVFSNVSNSNIFIMPIYATDSANGIVADNLTLYRTIVKQGQSTIIFNEQDIETNVANKVLLFNADPTFKTAIEAAEDTFVVTTIFVNGISYNITKAQIYIVDTALDPATTYNINYNANDKAENGINTKSYSMAVVNNFVDETAPVVTFAETLPTVMFGDDEITFAKPTATDNKDTRLSVYLTYQTDIDVNPIRVDSENSIITYNEDTQKYTLKLTDAYSTATQIEIKAYANDDSYTGTNPETNLGESEPQTISILYTGDVNDPTGVDIGEIDTTQNLVQGNDIVLPTVIYSDGLVNFVDLEIIIENGGTYFNAFDAEILRNTSAGTLTLQNAKFTADLSGTYNITYISTDAGNNITVVFYEIDIDVNPGTLTAAFTGLPSQINGGTAEKGVAFDLPTNVEVYLSSTDTLEVVGDIQVIVSGLTNYQTDRQTFFIANQVGTYKIQYVADVRYKVAIGTGDEFIEGGLKSKIFTIEVVDTTGPSADYTEIENFFADKNATKFAKGGSLVIPTPDLDNVNDLDLSQSYLTIASSYGTTTIKFDETTTITVEEIEQTVLKLDTAQTFTKDDTYTITYYLVDTAGNTNSQAFTLDVGDVIPPVLDVDSDLVAEQYNIGDKVAIDLSKISAIDDINGEILECNEGVYSVKTGASFTLTLKNTTTGATITNDLNSSSSNLNYQFTIETAGEYTITITASDLAGKTATYNDLTFTVGEENNAGLDAEEILGIVLIVLSVILLGGVIAYFVVSKKNLEKKYK